MNRCPHNHSMHTHIWRSADKSTCWMGLIEPIGVGLARYEPCPETDPDLAAEGPPRCVNCHRTDGNPAARSFDMDLPAPILCDLCTVALSSGDMETFRAMTRTLDIREGAKDALS